MSVGHPLRTPESLPDGADTTPCPAGTGRARAGLGGGFAGGLKTLSIVAASAWLAACGGGGDSAPAPAPAPAAAPAAPTVTTATLRGVAATGAPLAGAAVEVSDSQGQRVCTTTTDSQGAYTCTLATGAKAPLAITARGDDKLLVSVSAAAADATVNITPLTTLVAARLTPSGDPAALAAAIQAQPSIASAEQVKAKVEEVKTMLAPLLAALDDKVDPISGTFAANGSGHDKVLDALQVSIRPEASSANVEITVKAKPASDGAPPMSLSFKTSDAKPPALAAPLKPADLVDTGIAGQVNGLLGRLTACYAIPLAQRISGVAEGATTATGGAAAVQAPVCRSLFVDDNPAAYKDNGYTVGNGTFTGLFSEGGTGAKFDRGNFEYQLANGDVFLTLRSTSKTGNVQHLTLTARGQGGQLKLIGNQYAFDAAVRPFAAHRVFLQQPAYTWLGAGYNVSIRNQVDPVTRLPIFKEVKVTAPDGRTSLYRPTSGRSALSIVAENGQQRVNQVQFIGAAWVDTATPGHPMDKDGSSGAFFVTPQRSDDQIRALPDQGVWTLAFVMADASLPEVVQTYRTIGRAPTVGELRQMKFSRLSDGFKTELLARADVTGQNRVNFDAPSATAPNQFRFGTADGGAGWVVPDGAEPPISATVFGAFTGTGSFNDSVSMLSTDRQTTVKCSTQSATDKHCDSSTGLTQFAQGAWFNAFELWTRNGRQLEVQTQFNLYKLTP